MYTCMHAPICYLEFKVHTYWYGKSFKMAWKNKISVIVIGLMVIDCVTASGISIVNSNRYSKQESCPTTTAGAAGSTKQLLDPNTGKCFPFGQRGPCGKNMIFYEHPLYPKSQFPHYGFCDCDQGVKDKSGINHPIRRMIYMPGLDRCFPVFSQGPCYDGFWLNLNSTTNQPQCERNPCSKTARQSNHETSKFWFYDPLRKKCYLSHTQGYCPVGLTLEVTHNSHIPRCRRVAATFGQLSNLRSSLICKPGSRYSYFLKGCIASFTSARFRGIG